MRIALILVCAFWASLACAQWPQKSVRLVVPFAAGGATDVIARTLGQKLSEQWKQSVVVDNKPGAGGAIGASLVAKSPPDGFTIALIGGSQLTVNPHVYQKLPYSIDDFTIIANIASGAMVIVVNPGSPARTLKDFVSLAKDGPGKLTFGSAGNGTQVHMAGEALADAAGIDIRHVPYKGEALALNDVLAGQVELIVANIAAAAPLVKAGKLRALAVTGRSRSPMLPEVPTATEASLSGLEDIGAWFALVVPAGTPTDITRKLYADTSKVLRDGELDARFAAMGMRPGGEDAAQMKRVIAAESQKWARIVKERRLTAD